MSPRAQPAAQQPPALHLSHVLGEAMRAPDALEQVLLDPAFKFALCRAEQLSFGVRPPLLDRLVHVLLSEIEAHSPSMPGPTHHGSIWQNFPSQTSDLRTPQQLDKVTNLLLTQHRLVATLLHHVRCDTSTLFGYLWRNYGHVVRMHDQPQARMLPEIFAYAAKRAHILDLRCEIFASELLEVQTGQRGHEGVWDEYAAKTAYPFFLYYTVDHLAALLGAVDALQVLHLPWHRSPLLLPQQMAQVGALLVERAARTHLFGLNLLAACDGQTPLQHTGDDALALLRAHPGMLGQVFTLSIDVSLALGPERDQVVAENLAALGQLIQTHAPLLRDLRLANFAASTPAACRRQLPLLHDVAQQVQCLTLIEADSYFSMMLPQDGEALQRALGEVACLNVTQLSPAVAQDVRAALPGDRLHVLTDRCHAMLAQQQGALSADGRGCGPAGPAPSPDRPRGF